MAKPKLGTVMETGAPAGAVLIGIDDVNRGLRIRILKAQKPGHSGWIEIGFEVLDAGTGTYASALQPLVGDQFVSVREVLDRIRVEPSASKATFILSGSTLRVESAG